MQNIDQQKIVDFIQKTLGNPGFFRAQIIDNCREFFGYDKCTFWLADAKGHLYDPVSTMDDNFIKDYQTGFISYDHLHPQNIGIEQAKNEQVTSLRRIISKDDLAKSKFINLLDKYDLADMMNIYLQEEEHIIGVISIYRSSAENAFSKEDIAYWKILEPLLSLRLHENTLFEYTENIKSIFESFINKSETGCIIFGTSFTIYYCNSAALRICELFKDSEKNNSCVDFFINNILANHSYAWVSGMEKTLLLPSFEQVTLKIIPVTNNRINSKEKNLFMVIFEISAPLQPEIEENDQESALNNFSFRELEVINLVINGYSNQEIADELYISINTVKKHLSQIFAKTQVSNRTSLIHKISQAKANPDIFSAKKPLS